MTGLFQWLIRHKHLCNARCVRSAGVPSVFQWLIRHKHLCNTMQTAGAVAALKCFNGSFAINISATPGAVSKSWIEAKFQWLIRHKHLCNMGTDVPYGGIKVFQWLIRHKHLCNYPYVTNTGLIRPVSMAHSP